MKPSPSDFSVISVIQGIHRATYFPQQSESCFKNSIDFLNQIATEHQQLFRKQSVQKAFQVGLRNAIRHKRLHVLEHLEASSLLLLLKSKVLLETFTFSLQLHHKNFELMIRVLKKHAPHLLAHRKIQKAIECSLQRAYKLKRTSISQALLELE